VGAALLPVQEPLNPNENVPFVGTAALKLALTATTWLPDVVVVAFHACVTRCSDGKLHARRQPSRASPRLVTFTSAVKPLCHCDETV